MPVITLLKLAAPACLALVAWSAPGRGQGDPSVRQVATLTSPRSAHTATALPSGEVMIVGGMANEGANLASAELFDPARNAVRAVGALAVPRASHTATPLRNGRVLIAGGYNGEYLSSLEVFDPATRRFSPAGALTEGRSGHTATLLPDGRVLLIGGNGPGWSFLRTAELYDPATGRSEPVGSMEVPRAAHTATLLADGRVLVVGGHAGRRQEMVVHASAEAFNPSTRRFEPAGALATARHKHDAVRLPDGRVLVLGGADRTDRTFLASTEIHDPRAGGFTPGPSMANRRYKINGTTVLLPGGEVLVTAGAPAAELLDAGARGFREVPGRFPEGYHFPAVAPLEGGDVLITGGYGDGIRSTAGIWRFNRD